MATLKQVPTPPPPPEFDFIGLTRAEVYMLHFILGQIAGTSNVHRKLYDYLDEHVDDYEVSKFIEENFHQNLSALIITIDKK